jgi:hypothetical protein
MHPADAVLFWWCALVMHVRCEYVCYDLWVSLLGDVTYVHYSFKGPHKPTRARLVLSREGRLSHAVSSHSAPRLRPPHLPHAATHSTPLHWDARHTTLGATHTTPLTTRSRWGGTQLRWRQWRRRLGEGGIQPRGRREDEDVAASRHRRGVEIPPLWQCEGQWRI